MSKTIVVTGATSGLGLALIHTLKSGGYDPIFTGRIGDKITRLAAL